MKTAKRISVEDVHIGRRIAQRRVELGLSQGDLGGALGVTFQQVQKYEKGANRVSGGRLLRIARALKVDVQWFYDGLGQTVADPEAGKITAAFVASSQGRTIVNLWPRLSAAKRMAAVEVLRAMAGDMP